MRVLGIARNGENLSVEGSELLELRVEGEDLGGADLSFGGGEAKESAFCGGVIQQHSKCSRKSSPWGRLWSEKQAVVSYSSNRRPGNDLPRRRAQSPKSPPSEKEGRHTEEDEPLSLELVELDGLEEAIGDNRGLCPASVISSAHSAATRSVKLLATQGGTHLKVGGGALDTSRHFYLSVVR